jgi:hypothetical protein
VTATATIWRTCPVCGRSFEQPDDPGRKRVYCSRACQQAAYRARQRAGASGAGQQRTGRQEQRSGQRQQRASSGGSGAGQRQGGGRQANDDAWWRARERYQRQRQEQRQPPPSGANGQRPGATSGAYRQRPKVACYQCHGLRARGHTFHHDQAAHERAWRRYEALLRKAAGTTFEHEAGACRAKAEALYDKYGL